MYLVWFLLAIIIVIAVYFKILVYRSSAPTLGVVNGQLLPCPQTPNCVCSESSATRDNDNAYIEAIKSAAPASDLAKLKNIVADQGGEIVSFDVEAGYLYATFTSKWFAFVDDFELRIDKEQSLIHVRSASRVGRSDFSANQKRITSIRGALLEQG